MSGRQETIDGVRRMLDVLEANPNIPLPSYLGQNHYERVQWYVASPIEAARLVRALGGKWDKNNPKDSEYDAEYLVMIATIWDTTSVRVVVSREGTCEKKQVGTTRQMVTKEIVPAQTEFAYEDVPVYEYECKSIMSLADQALMDELESLA